MDLQTLDKINFLHPAVRKEALEIYKYINNTLFGKYIRLRFTHTFRTNKEQDELYAQGRTIFFDKKGNRLGKVTGAKGGQSIHNYGLAIDFVVLVDADKNGTFETASWDVKKDLDGDGVSDWMEAVKFFKSKGWVWGGDWKSLIDPPHFEKTFGNSWIDLQAKFNKGDTFEEKINGKIYKWVNL